MNRASVVLSDTIQQSPEPPKPPVCNHVSPDNEQGIHCILCTVHEAGNYTMYYCIYCMLRTILKFTIKARAASTHTSEMMHATHATATCSKPTKHTHPSRTPPPRTPSRTPVANLFPHGPPRAPPSRTPSRIPTHKQKSRQHLLLVRRPSRDLGDLLVGQQQLLWIIFVGPLHV